MGQKEDIENWNLTQKEPVICWKCMIVRPRGSMCRTDRGYLCKHGCANRRLKGNEYKYKGKVSVR